MSDESQPLGQKEAGKPRRALRCVGNRGDCMKALKSQSSLDAFQELAQKDDQKLEEVWQRVEDGCRELIALKFSEGVLTFTVDPDTDTVEVRRLDAEAFDPSGLVLAPATAPWTGLLGRPFGWGWAAVNQQGYQDGVLLSFGGLEPSVLLVVAASSLRVYAVNELANNKG